jgi:hypothetical protein
MYTTEIDERLRHLSHEERGIDDRGSKIEDRR